MIEGGNHAGSGLLEQGSKPLDPWNITSLRSVNDWKKEGFSLLLCFLMQWSLLRATMKSFGPMTQVGNDMCKGSTELPFHLRQFGSLRRPPKLAF